MTPLPPPPHPQIEQCPAHFLGLIVQPRKEPCGSAAGFEFLTMEVIQIEKKTNNCQFLKLRQWLIACSVPASSVFEFCELLHNVKY